MVRAEERCVRDGTNPTWLATHDERRLRAAHTNTDLVTRQKEAKLKRCIGLPGRCGCRLHFGNLIESFHHLRRALRGLDLSPLVVAEGGPGRRKLPLPFPAVPQLRRRCTNIETGGRAFASRQPTKTSQDQEDYDEARTAPHWA